MAASTDRADAGAAAGAAWELPAPFTLALAVDDAEIDAYAHVNNAVYLTWLDRAAWAHSAALGLPVERCLELDRGMAVLRTAIHYARPALRGDRIVVGTWLLPADMRFRARRRFQVRRETDGATLARAEIEYVCLQLSTGRPVRAPPEFRERYAALAVVDAQVEALAPI